MDSIPCGTGGHGSVFSVGWWCECHITWGCRCSHDASRCDERLGWWYNRSGCLPLLICVRMIIPIIGSRLIQVPWQPWTPHATPSILRTVLLFACPPAFFQVIPIIISLALCLSESLPFRILIWHIFHPFLFLFLLFICLLLCFLH